MRFLIVDDHPLVCSALEGMLTTAFAPCDLVQTHSAAKALETVQHRKDFALILLDLQLPDADGLQALLQLRREAPQCPILVFSGTGDATAMQAVRNCGARGYISAKSSVPQVVAAVRSVLAGKTAFAPAPGAPKDAARRGRRPRAFDKLTPQQATVLRLLGEGLLNKQIAYELSISESTVKAHVSAILKKLDVSSRIQAALLAQRGVPARPSASLTGAEEQRPSPDR